MKSHELLKLLNNLPESTLRKYAQDYQQYLSASSAIRHREYTEQDARILRLIVDMKAQRIKADDIDVTLSSLQAGDWEQLPKLNEADQRIMPTESAVVALQSDKIAMQREIELLREQLANQEAKHVEELKTERSDRDELLARLHKAETMLDLYEQGRLHPHIPPT